MVMLILVIIRFCNPNEGLGSQTHYVIFIFLIVNQKIYSHSLIIHKSVLLGRRYVFFIIRKIYNVKCLWLGLTRNTIRTCMLGTSYAEMC